MATCGRPRRVVAHRSLGHTVTMWLVSVAASGCCEHFGTVRRVRPGLMAAALLQASVDARVKERSSAAEPARTDRGGSGPQGQRGRAGELSGESTDLSTCHRGRVRDRHILPGRRRRPGNLPVGNSVSRVCGHPVLGPDSHLPRSIASRSRLSAPNPRLNRTVPPPRPQVTNYYPQIRCYVVSESH